MVTPREESIHIYWNHNSRCYEPDFIVEAGDTIYLVETKKEGDIDLHNSFKLEKEIFQAISRELRPFLGRSC